MDEHGGSEHDRMLPPHALSVNIDQRGQSVDSQTNAGRDVQHRDDIDSRGVRRRTHSVYEDELITAVHDLKQQITSLNNALNELRNNNAALQTEVALLKYQVGHLNERLRQTGSSWGAAQWIMLTFVLSIAVGIAVYVSLAG